MIQLRLAMCVVFLAGCALRPVPYREPVGGPVATIDFKNKGSASLQLYFFEKSKNCTGRRSVGGLASNETHSSRVRGDEEFTFLYSLSKAGEWGTRLSCSSILRFSPKAQGHYVFLSGDDSHGCKWVMLDTSAEGDPQRVKLTELYSWKVGWDENSSFCNETE